MFVPPSTYYIYIYVAGSIKLVYLPIQEWLISMVHTLMLLVRRHLLKMACQKFGDWLFIVLTIEMFAKIKLVNQPPISSSN